MMKVSDKWGNEQGEFLTYEIRPVIRQLFQERGIDLDEFCDDISVKRLQGNLEIDFLAASAVDAVVVIVRKKLTQADVDEHLERLGKFKQLMPRYADVRALGAVAAMVVPEDIARYAYRKGLFVLAQSGEDIVILNDDKFQPRVF